MSTTDGVLRAHYEVHCRGCERPYLGLGTDHQKAVEALRRDGWRLRREVIDRRQRRRRWYCPDCAPPSTTKD